MKNVFFVLILIIFTACRSDSSNDSKNYEYRTNQTSQVKSHQNNKAFGNAHASVVTLEIERKTIKTVNIRFLVKDLVGSTKRIEAITEQYGGFISGMNQSTSHSSIDNKMTLRVPAEVLEKFLAEIEQESIYTHYKRIHVEDVTEEFVDKTSRLNTKKEVRDRYITILRDKAGTVEDILNAEEKIRVIQEEIEAIEGRLKYLDNQTALSTVSIEMYQKSNKNTVVYEKTFFTKIADGFMSGWVLVKETLIGLVTIWPILLVALAAFLARKRIGKVLVSKS